MRSHEKKEDVYLQEITLGSLLDSTASKYPEKEAIVYVDRDFRLTYRGFADLVDRLAKGLMAVGVEKGEKVALWAPNVPYWIALQFATAKIGAILLTVNTHYKLDELKYLLKQSEAENIFLVEGYRDSNYLDMVYELIPELKESPREYFKSTQFPHLKRVFFLGHEKYKGLYSIPELIGLGRLIGDAEYIRRQREVSPHDVVNMQYTSGTTGFPKGVMLTHYNILNNGYWVGENMKLSPEDKICLPVPLFHCFGCVLGVLAAVSHGSSLVVLEEFNPLFVMTSVHSERCTALYGVPTMFIALLEHSMFSRFDYSSLRTGIMAGSPCPVRVMREVMDKMNMREITICYGLTEASPVMTQTRRDDPIEKRVETVGRPLPGIEVKVVDTKTGETLPPGLQGEVCCRGYNVMKGYYKMEEATREAIDKDGWLHSGDLGMFDEDGYLSITGRLKDMIIRGGENIYPREIEEFLYQMEGIYDVQVVGVPSEKYGEEVGAFIILKDGYSYTPEDIKEFCRGRLARYKIPKYIAFVNEYEMTASGKVQKFKLREKAARLFAPHLT